MPATKAACFAELAEHWTWIRQRVRSLQQLFDELNEAEADCPWCEPATPTHTVPQQLLQLQSHLKQLFSCEESDFQVTQLLEIAPESVDRLRQLQGEHTSLLRMLAELHELSGSPHAPATSWSDIEARFENFAEALSRHEHREMSFLQHILLDETGVID